MPVPWRELREAARAGADHQKRVPVVRARPVHRKPAAPTKGTGVGRSGECGYSDVALLGVCRNRNRSLSAGRTSVVPSVRNTRYAWRLRVKA